MTDENDQSPKIYVDDDWKEEARREKEAIDRETRESAGRRQLPEPSFAEIIQMITLQATIGLGGMQDPQTGQQLPPNMPIAKHYIDLLELLATKTGSNLDEQERALLQGTLHELRMAFVQATGMPPQPRAEPKPETNT
jgi:hypothetical protein